MKCCGNPIPNDFMNACENCKTQLWPPRDPPNLLSLDAYKLRKKLAVDTTRAQMELAVSNLLDDIRADRVEGFVFAADMKEGHARVEAGGQMSCASALWLGQMIINKVGPS